MQPYPAPESNQSDSGQSSTTHTPQLQRSTVLPGFTLTKCFADDLVLLIAIDGEQENGQHFALSKSIEYSRNINSSLTIQKFNLSLTFMAMRHFGMAEL